MASFSDEVVPRDTGSTRGRRDFMWKAAVVGTGAFVMPTIITVDPADAQALTSHRPSHPDGRSRLRSTSVVPPAPRLRPPPAPSRAPGLQAAG